MRLASAWLAGHSGRDHAGAPEAELLDLCPRSSVPDSAIALTLEDLSMPDAVKVGFVPFSAAARGTLVVFCDDALKFGAAASKTLGAASGLVKRAAGAQRFKGKSGSILDVLAPEGLKAARLIVIGTGKVSALKNSDLLKFGGILAGKVRTGGNVVTVIADL